METRSHHAAIIEGDRHIVEVGWLVTPDPNVAHIGDEDAFLVVRLSRNRLAHRGLNLHAQKMSAVFDGDIVGRAVSPRLGKFETQLGGLCHEAQFCPLATLLGFPDTHAC